MSNKIKWIEKKTFTLLFFFLRNSLVFNLKPSICYTPVSCEVKCYWRTVYIKYHRIVGTTRSILGCLGFKEENSHLSKRCNLSRTRTHLKISFTLSMLKSIIIWNLPRMALVQQPDFTLVRTENNFKMDCCIGDG